METAPSQKVTVPKRPLTWLITGASSGLGLGLARHAQSRGHYVIGTSRSVARDASLAAEISSHPSGGRWLTLDVADLGSAAIIEDLEEREGVHIDVLVNSAGFSMHGPAEQFTEEETRELFDTDFFGPYRLMRAVAPYMRARRSGLILNISTGAALDGAPSMGIYAAGKAALDGS